MQKLSTERTSRPTKKELSRRKLQRPEDYIRVSRRTAMRRRRASAPLLWLCREDLIRGDVLDFGCGHGDDVEHLLKVANIGRVWGYDPNLKPDRGVLRRRFDTVLCTYVLNVLPKSMEKPLLEKLRSLLSKEGCAYVTVRRDIVEEGVTGSGSYQRTVRLSRTQAGLVHETRHYAIYRIKPVKEKNE